MLVAFMVSEFIHAGLLFSSTICKFMTFAREEIDTSVIELTKLKAYIYLADLKVSLLKDTITHPAPDN